ncbi:MAG: hypothetical protein HZA37_02040 [Parcubacteria group bacterium]|nr:hypothetical protein [Parcubacteria group bacterium]
MNEPFQNNPGGSQDVPRSGAGVPPPPPPPIEIRTMESDLKSLQESGGAAITPKPIATAPPSVSAEKPEEVKLTIPGYTGPEEPLFSADLSVPAAQAAVSAKSNLLKIALVALGAIAVAGVVGVVSYLYIYPKLFPAAEPAVVEQPPVEKPAEPVIPPAPKVVHKSFLTIAADLTEEAKLSAVDLASLLGGLRQSAADKRAPGTFKEIVFTGSVGFIASSDLFSVLVPELNLKNSFGDDYTAAVYYDESGAWPVYILKLKTGVLVAEAQLAVSRLESSLNLKNLFVADPGAMSQEGFKNGKIGDRQTRYAAFSAKGAAVNYGWFGDYVIVGSSYPAFKEAARRTGF